MAARHGTQAPETFESHDRAPTPKTLVHRNFAPAPVTNLEFPEAATPEKSSPVLDGQIPASDVHLPRLDASRHLPAAPIPPPDPQTTTPAKDNPGGVNGSRPPREASLTPHFLESNAEGSAESP
jgi:hypothetical protein